jgi:ABC-type glycerol-3-phosphate transport system substrate-binding protein
MQANGILPDDPVTWGTANMPAAFMQGNVAFWFTGTWQVATFDRDKPNLPGFDYGQLAIPPLRTGGTPQLAMGLGGGLHIWSNTQQREATVGWAEYSIFTPTAQRWWIETAKEIPPIPFKPEDFNATGGWLDTLKLAEKATDLGLNLMPLVSGTFRPFFWSTSQELLENKIGPTEWGQRLQRQWEQEKREGKVPRQ